jgi:LPXTG-site transpeptidase (sortase) family protein
VAVTSVTYDDQGSGGSFEATLQLNGGTPLPNGNYRLFVCGTTSITDVALNHLAGDGANPGSDFIRNFTVAVSGAATGTSGAPGGTPAEEAEALPATGFPPDRVTPLEAQPAYLTYQGLGLQLEIPRLGLEMPVVGVPQENGTWNVTWLGREVGWLEGTAFPTWVGNAVLTGHVTDAEGRPGPFAHLENLGYDDEVVIHLAGQRYEFRVREKRLVQPTNTHFALAHLEGYPYLTLVTCRGFDEAHGTYQWRWVIRAVLVSVTDDE